MQCCNLSFFFFLIISLLRTCRTSVSDKERHCLIMGARNVLTQHMPTKSIISDISAAIGKRKSSTIRRLLRLYFVKKNAVTSYSIRLNLIDMNRHSVTEAYLFISHEN